MVLAIALLTEVVRIDFGPTLFRNLHPVIVGSVKKWGYVLSILPQIYRMCLGCVRVGQRELQGCRVL